MPSRTDEYALLAEFDRAEALLAAAGAIRQAGYRAIDAFSPFPLEGLAGALGFTERWLPLVALAGGVAGGFGGFLLQFGMNAWDYPINVGGRPLDAWPAFAVAAFEMTVLGAALAVLLGLLVLCRLPRLNHPVFESERFKRVTVDRFFLVVRSDDPRFDEPRLRQMLEQAGAVGIEEVPA